MLATSSCARVLLLEAARRFWRACVRFFRRLSHHCLALFRLHLHALTSFNSRGSRKLYKNVQTPHTKGVGFLFLLHERVGILSLCLSLCALAFIFLVFLSSRFRYLRALLSSPGTVTRPRVSATLGYTLYQEREVLAVAVVCRMVFLCSSPYYHYAVFFFFSIGVQL